MNCAKLGLTVRSPNPPDIVIALLSAQNLCANGVYSSIYFEILHNLYPSPGIIRIFKSKRMRWAGHVA
jgi:hypothetical protein